MAEQCAFGFIAAMTMIDTAPWESSLAVLMNYQNNVVTFYSSHFTTGTL